MVDWNKKFKSQYDAAKAVVAKTDDFDRDWRPLVRQLQKLMATTASMPARRSR